MNKNIQITGKVTLAEVRAIAGMTQEKFAKFVGIPYTTYRRYEKKYWKCGIF